MNKEKEIIEMGEEIGRALGITYEGERLPFTMHTRSYLSKELIEAGYRKATEKEQEEERREEEIMSLTAQVEVLQSEKDNLLRTLEETGEELRDIRKETAKEIIDELKGCYSTAMLTFNHETAETLKSLFLRLEKEYEVD